MFIHQELLNERGDRLRRNSAQRRFVRMTRCRSARRRSRLLGTRRS